MRLDHYLFQLDLTNRFVIIAAYLSGFQSLTRWDGKGRVTDKVRTAALADPTIQICRSLSSRLNGEDLQVSGRHGEGETPVPIPNTAVKPFSADGTVPVGGTGE